VSTPIAGITESDIANYLANTPAFFERHAELLATVTLTSPHGQRAVSLQERQMEMLRERIKGLEGKIVEMIRHGQENLALTDRLHRWARALLLTGEAARLPEVALAELQHQFLIPQAALRLWGTDAAFFELPATQPVSDDAKSLAGSLSLPYCGANNGFDAASWLPDTSAVASLAMVPLRHTRQPGAAQTFGLLVLASPDPTRYSADMGTEFLMRIGEMASAALTRLLPRG
jgi:uncharacterized protein